MLNQIVAAIREQVAILKQTQPLDPLSIQPASFALSRALEAADWTLIAECKLTSPAKGPLCDSRSVPELARIFTDNGATALSVHTSAPFQGKLADIAAVRAVSPLPILRKDFIVDPYQLLEARVAGADAALLIVAALGRERLEELMAAAAEIGLDTLVEVHDDDEVETAVEAGAEIIGINNRDLHSLEVDLSTSFRLLADVPAGTVVVAESGITSREDVLRVTRD